MIVRTWTAQTIPDREGAYVEQVNRVVLPHLRATAGYRGARFLKRHEGGKLKILVMTFWESMVAARGLGGGESGSAWLPPEIAATLEHWDSDALHYEELLSDQ